MQVVQPTTEEYPEEGKERVGLCGEDGVELEERVKVEDGRVGERSCDCVERGTLRRWRRGVQRTDVRELVVVGRISAYIIYHGQLV